MVLATFVPPLCVSKARRMMGEVVLLRCGSGGFHGHAMATTVIQKLFLYLYGFFMVLVLSVALNKRT